MSKCNLCSTDKSFLFSMKSCNHKICHECMNNHLAKLESAKIKCPVKGCSTRITDAIIRECLSNDMIKYYDELCFPQSNIYKCGIKNCFYFVSYENKYNKFECPNCHQPNCITCGKMHYPTEECGTDRTIEFEKAAVQHLTKLHRANIESVDEEYALIPNPESFTCEICCEFFLPRKGVTLRNCLHTFCSDCLTATYDSEKKHFNQLVCTSCSAPLHERERKEFIGDKTLNLMSMDFLKTKFFNCKACDCDGVWDIGDYKGKYRCPKCNEENCIACEYVHENQTCEEFRKSKAYKSTAAFMKTIDKQPHVTCLNCGRILIHLRGCGALRCDKCNIHICQFTGKAVGVGGCNCTPSKPCHKDCKYGCIPE